MSDLETRIAALEQRVAVLEAKKKSRQPLTEAEWFAELKTSPLYQGIDIDREYAKMIEWCKPRNYQPTRRRFINWLNRADKPLNGGSGNGGFDKYREELLMALKDQGNRVMPQLSAGAKKLFYDQNKHWRDLQTEVQAGVIAIQ